LVRLPARRTSRQPLDIKATFCTAGFSILFDATFDGQAGGHRGDAQASELFTDLFTMTAAGSGRGSSSIVLLHAAVSPAMTVVPSRGDPVPLLLGSPRMVTLSGTSISAAWPHPKTPSAFGQRQAGLALAASGGYQ
jgi:hypothetical protein